MKFLNMVSSIYIVNNNKNVALNYRLGINYYRLGKDLLLLTLPISLARQWAGSLGPLNSSFNLFVCYFLFVNLLD